jgi:transcriptional regulator with XRE-family HTH domain
MSEFHRQCVFSALAVVGGVDGKNVFFPSAQLCGVVLPDAVNIDRVDVAQRTEQPFFTELAVVGKQIKAVRKAMKMTQEQLALKSNVSVKYIANIENGKQNPSFDILSSILHVLPLSLDSVINPNLSEAERECRELESIYFACPPEMQKTLLDATRSLAIHLTELSEQNKNN